MSHEVLDRIAELAPYLAEQAEQAEQAGRLPEETAKRLKETGVIRLLQPTEYGGYEADPRVFFEAVMTIASNCGASGWVTGIVGVHPWELAACDQKLQAEIWGEDPDTWVCSTYMPTGRATAVDGGWQLSGRWGFSSGCDLAEWIILGGMIVDQDGQMTNPPQYFHFFLPKSDFEIIEGTWEVVGLSGTGSKDVVVDNVFVPHHHGIDAMQIHTGAAAATLKKPSIFQLPWASIFPNAITSATIGIAEGALRAALAYQRTRIGVFTGGPVTDSPTVMSTIGEAAGDIDASRAQLLRNLGDMWGYVQRDEDVPLALRARGRRDQVQGSWRATRAVDQLFDYAGGGSLRKGTPLQRFWRDSHAALHHMINVPDKSYHSFSSVAMGFDPLETMI